MHELSLTREIVAIACQAAGDRRIVTIGLEIGALCCVSPAALAFCFDAVAEGTPAAGARLDVERTDGDELRVTTMQVEEAA